MQERNELCTVTKWQLNENLPVGDAHPLALGIALVGRIAIVVELIVVDLEVVILDVQLLIAGKSSGFTFVPPEEGGVEVRRDRGIKDQGGGDRGTGQARRGSGCRGGSRGGSGYVGGASSGHQQNDGGPSQFG